MTIYMWIASAGWALLTLGVLFRRQRSFHIPLVVTAMCIDYLLVLYLEVTRGAIEKAFSSSLELLKQLHVGASATAVVLYIPVTYLGLRALRGTATLDQRTAHRNLALTAWSFRTAGFILMFSMWK